VLLGGPFLAPLSGPHHRLAARAFEPLLLIDDCII
jgi:hypothetical protein